MLQRNYHGALLCPYETPPSISGLNYPCRLKNQGKAELTLEPQPKAKSQEDRKPSIQGKKCPRNSKDYQQENLTQSNHQRNINETTEPPCYNEAALSRGIHFKIWGCYPMSPLFCRPGAFPQPKITSAERLWL